MYDINLLPIEKAKGKLSFVDNKLKMILFGTVAASVLIIIVSIVFSMLASGYKSDINAMNKNLIKYNTAKKTITDYNTKNEKLNRINSIITAASNVNTDMTNVLDKLGSVMPDEVSTLKLTFANKGNITADGSSKDNDSIAYFIYKLKQTGAFSNILVKSIKQDEKAGNYTFSLILALKSNSVPVK